MAEYIRQDHHLPHGSLEPSITNGDRLRMMTDEELAEYLADIELKFCNYRPPLDVDTERWLEWLKKDAEDG